MKKMRRLLAALLVTTMLFGSNGFSYAAEAVGGGTEETTQETTAVEEPESEVIEETAPEETNVEDTSNQETTESEDSETEEETKEEAVTEESASEETEADTESSASGETEAVAAEEEEGVQKEETLPAAETGKTSEVKTEEKKPAVKTEYTYSDDKVDVAATLQRADAVPDDAELVVTPVTPQADGYNYDAYMDALNDQAEDGKEYNSDNTLLYDIAFMYEEKDAEGNGTGKIIEYQPESGSVMISISFKQDQLRDQIAVEGNENEEVEILHLPLTESVRESVDTTAEATNISKDDIRVESVQSEQVDVDGENAEFKVSGLSVLSVARPKKAPLRAGAGVTGTISFFNEQATQKAPFEPANGDDYFILVTLKEKEGENAGEIAGWGIQHISAAEITGQPEFAFAVNEFYAFGEDGTTTDTPLDYDASAYDVSSRLFHTAEAVTNYQEAVAQDDSIPGYTFMGSKYGANASNSYANPATINLLKKTEDNKFFVQIQADENGDVPAAGDYFLAVKAERENNQFSYYCAPFTISAGDFDAHNKLDIPITEWTNEDGQTESPAQHFSTNWKSFEVVIAARKPEKKGEAITPKRCIGGDANNFVYQVGVGGILGEFTLKEDKGVTEETKITDSHGHEEWRYVLSLEKVKLEPLIEPKDVLGEAVNFGVVANSYIQSGHTETNFAVNSFACPYGNLDLDGAGATPAPFYVGQISGKINPTERNSAPLEFHTPQTEFSKLEMGNVHQPVYVYDTTPGSVAAYVAKLQRAGLANADEMLGKTTISPVSSASEYVLDISGLEDNKTVYVNADGIADVIAHNGLTIKKKPGQYIVFNFSNPDTVNIGRFNVTTVDGGSETTIPSTTQIYGDEGSGAAENQKTDEVILKHITFNAANASKVNITEASGLFLCPRAIEVTNINGAGWVLAKETVRSEGSEWHFFFHGRDVIELGYELKGNKKLTDKDGNPIDYQDKGFKFDIYEEGEDGNETGSALFSATADSDGVVKFDRRVLTNEDVPKGVKKVFKYIIKEDTSGCVEKDGKYYKDGFEYSDQKIHLVITAENISTNSQPCITVKMTVDGERVDGDIHTVFEFGALTNKKSEETVEISAKKAWSPSAPEGASVVFTLCKGGDATDKTVTLNGEVDENGESEAWTATFKDLPKYDGDTEIEYTVKETTGYTGYTASTTEGVTNGGTITNTQETVEISAKKAWSPAAPEGASVVFTLCKGGDATEQTVTLNGEVDENGESKPWTATFKDLPKYDGDTEIEYTVKETTGYTGYTASTTEGVTNGGTITNAQETVEISAKKAWSPAAPEGASVVFTLCKGGDATEQTVTLNGEVDENGESKPWTATFKDLPKYDSGVEINYTVKETTGYTGYTASTTEGVTNGGTITNAQETVEISAKKAWSPAAPEGASVVFTLCKGGDATEQTVTLNGEVDENGESKPWTATFKDLPKYDSGVEINYTVKETTGYPGYTASTTEGVTNGGTITNTEAVIKVSKKDINSSDELPGAVIQILKGNEVIEQWTSGTIAHEIKGLEVGTEYTLREITAPDGYTLAVDTTFSIKQDGTVDTTGSVDGDTLLINDVKTKVKISKVDITSQDEIAGATLQILDSEGNVVELNGQKLSWVSSTEGPHIIEGLKTGVEYTLHEETAPAGYTVAADTKFTIGTDGSVNSGAPQTEDNVLLVEDALTEVKVSKIDIAGGEEVAGAQIMILDAKGTVVDSWTSSVDDESTEDVNEAIHIIKGLNTGVTYTLHEEVAPDGYTVSTDTTFTIDKEGNVTTTGTVSEDGVLLVEDSKTTVKVSKVDVAGGEELAGATIQIIEKDAEGNEKVVEEWVSAKDKEETADVNEGIHIVEGLKAGVEYTLRETVAPDGYTVTTDTTFTIDKEGNVTTTGTVSEDGVLLVEDSKTTVKVSKVDVAGGEELAGATIQIIEKDAEGNELVVEEWVSAKDKEETADVDEGIHIVEGLKAGVEYTLRETVAPEGYAVTTDTTFTIDKEGNVTTTGTVSEDGVLLVEDSKTTVKVSKVDVAGGEELAGATIQIIEKDAEGNEKVVEAWTSGKEAYEIEGLKTGVEYTLRETVAPEGYTVTTDTTFTIDNTGKVTSSGTVSEDGVLLVEDAKTKISVSKVDIAGGEELEGAHIQIILKEGIFGKETIIKEWDSTKEAYKIEGLKTGVEYILRETVAPEGYTVTTDTKFSIDETGKVTSTGNVSKDGVILVEDAKTKISVSKVDVAGGKELAGATIQVIEKDEDGKEKVVNEWVSAEDDEKTADVNEGIHVIEGLKTGVEYTLRETVAPEGYAVTADTTFTIDETGKVTSTSTKIKDGLLLVEDALTKVKVSKTDIADGKELEGAHIQILDKDGNIVDEWDSTKKAHEIEGLKTEVEYVLRETVAPDGYTVTTDIKFTIDKNGKVKSSGSVTEDGTLLINDSKTKISVSKVDIAGGEELEGAHIQILDSKGSVVEEWDSRKEAHVIEGLKTGEVYTLKETLAPDGYTVAAETTFTINEKGEVKSTATVTSDGVILVEDAKTKVSVSKTDVADGEELEGAHIQIIVKEGLFAEERVVTEWDSTKEPHVVEGLKTGVEYILRETVAPEGYTVTTDTKFSIDETGKVTSTGTVSEDGVILVEDAKTKISVSKVDIADGEELEGATIQILEKGQVVEEWVSTKEAHKIEGLKTGVEYTLKETVAPEGYAVTTNTTFTIDETGKVTSTGTVSEDGVLLVEDAKTKVSVSKVDIADGKEIEGAHIQIIEKDAEGNEKVVEEWVSTKEAHKIEGLKTGVEYTLRETVAPEGYAVTTDTTFTIDKEGKVTTTGTVSKDGVLLVEDAKTKVKVSKVDIADGEEVEGAHIQIIEKDEEGKETVVREWVSTTEAKEIEGLKTGVEYTLRETVAPEGYAVTTDTTFTIDEKGKVTSTGTVTEEGVMLVEDAMTVVKVSKVDVADGKELEGAHIQIIKKGLFGRETVVEEWDSTKEVHEVVGLTTGVEYILRETVAPDGYAVTTDTTFTLDAAGNVKSSGTVSKDGVMLVEDAKTVVKVSKVDVADGKELEGAKIQILDENGKVVEEWVSGKTPHVIEGLKTGVKYTLRETVAPEGYDITTDTTFTIDKYGKVTTTGSMTKDGILLVEDAKKGTPKKSTPKKHKDSTRTGDDADAMLWLLIGLGATGSLAYVTRRRRKVK